MMGALQKHFTYKFTYMYGIPPMTLLGERADWEDILGRLEKLKTFGEEPTHWYHLLKPALTRFVMTFDTPASPEITDFWTRIINRLGGCGIGEISGWLTAFCLWDEDGQLLYNPAPAESVTQFSNYGSTSRWVVLDKGLCLDGQTYGRFDMGSLPRGYATVPIKCNDNGCQFCWNRS